MRRLVEWLSPVNEGDPGDDLEGGIGRMAALGHTRIFDEAAEGLGQDRIRTTGQQGAKAVTCSPQSNWVMNEHRLRLAGHLACAGRPRGEREPGNSRRRIPVLAHPLPSLGSFAG